MPDDARLAARIALALAAAGNNEAALVGLEGVVPLEAMTKLHLAGGDDVNPAGASVMIHTRAPISAATALAALDGVAARLILCPPGLDGSALAHAAEVAGVSLIVTDMANDAYGRGDLRAIRVSTNSAPAPPTASGVARKTEWALFTSGTSGPPKLAVHTMDGLSGAITSAVADRVQVWATFYDIRRYGGLQMLLRALLGGRTLVTADPDEPSASLITRMSAWGATHIAGTPTHWRRALMTPEIETLRPRYVRLSGEIADQAVLDALKTRFPEAVVAHAYASTEAGVGFEVTDGLAGFPAAFLDRPGPVQLRVRDDILRVSSDRAALRYLGSDESIRDADGFVDTGDMVERRGDRFHFVGRASGVINVGGLKIHPEEVEAVINACPGVRLSRVRARRSPLLGALVAAEVVAEPGAAPDVVRAAIAERCRATLAPHKAPASVKFVDALAMSAGGKLERPRA